MYIAFRHFAAKGKRLNRTAKNNIFSVYSYFEEQHRKSKFRVAAKLSSKTAQATGYSIRTVERVVAMNRASSGAAFQSPDIQLAGRVLSLMTSLRRL